MPQPQLIAATPWDREAARDEMVDRATSITGVLDGHLVGVLSEPLLITVSGNPAQAVDNRRRTLKLYIGGWEAGVRLHVYLTDPSSPAYTDTFDAGGTSVEKTYTLNYSAAESNQSLIIRATVGSAHIPNGNVTFQAAGLQS